MGLQLCRCDSGTGLLWLSNRSWILEGIIRSPFLLSSYLAKTTISWQSGNCFPLPYFFLYLLSVLCPRKMCGLSSPMGKVWVEPNHTTAKKRGILLLFLSNCKRKSTTGEYRSKRTNCPVRTLDNFCYQCNTVNLKILPSRRPWEQGWPLDGWHSWLSAPSPPCHRLPPETFNCASLNQKLILYMCLS